jgi:hypothetical protein
MTRREGRARIAGVGTAMLVTSTLGSGHVTGRSEPVISNTEPPVCGLSHEYKSIKGLCSQRSKIAGVGTAMLVTSTLGSSHVTGRSVPVKHRASSVGYVARILINKRPMFSTLQDCRSWNCHGRSPVHWVRAMLPQRSKIAGVGTATDGHQYIGFQPCDYCAVCRTNTNQRRAKVLNAPVSREEIHCDREERVTYLPLRCAYIAAFLFAKSPDIDPLKND